MRRVAAMTFRREDGMPIIHGEGECTALWSKVVMKEIAKMNEAHEKELLTMSYKLHHLESKLDEKRARDLKDLRKRLAKPTSHWERLKEKVEIAWCVFVGTIIELRNDRGCRQR